MCYAFFLTGTNNMCGVLTVRVTSNGSVNYGSLPNNITASTGTNYIKFINNNEGNALGIFMAKLDYSIKN